MSTPFTTAGKGCTPTGFSFDEELPVGDYELYTKVTKNGVIVNDMFTFNLRY